MTIARLELDEFPSALAEVLGPRIARLGYLGEFFRVCAHQPDALQSFLTFTEDLKAALPAEVTEIVALSVATTLQNAYERNQHERLCEKLGFSREWIVAVERCDPDAAAGLAPSEADVQRLALAMLARGGRDCARELDAVVAGYGEKIGVGVLMLVGRYATHAMIVNALQLAPPVPSIFEGARS